MGLSGLSWFVTRLPHTVGVAQLDTVSATVTVRILLTETGAPHKATRRKVQPKGVSWTSSTCTNRNKTKNIVEEQKWG